MRARHLFRHGLVVLILLASYLLIFIGRRTALPNTPYVLVIQPGVSDTSVQLVTTGLKLADDYLVRMTGRTLAAPTEVRVASFSPCSPLYPIPPLASTAEALGSRLCINTSSSVWQQALWSSPGIALSVVAHEHYHVVQNELGCLPRPWNKRYDWLIEGTASYVGWETAIASGNLDRQQVDMLLHTIRTSDPNLHTLASYERGIGGDASYSLAYSAVQQLVQKTGSVSSLNAFCTRVGQGTEWHSAFEQVFGVTVEAFYAAFEASH